MPYDLIGLIPAAGKGLRLGLPYPKELYPIIRENRYKPVAQFVVENMVASGIPHIVFVINETKHQLIGYFGDGSRFGCDISYVVQESREDKNNSTSPGLAHALDSAYHLIRNKTVCFGMADTIMTPKNLFINLIMELDQTIAVLLGLFRTEHPEKFGMVEMEKDFQVVQIIDKPLHTTLESMWGCMVWQPVFSEFLHNCIRQEKTSDFAYVLNFAIQARLQLRGSMIEGGTYNDLGTYEEIRDLDLKSRELD
jgi:glucose-1-phosphate thymidylyltransferase